MSCCPQSVLRVFNNPPAQNPDPVFGEAFGDGLTDLQSTPSGQWTPVTGTDVTLSEPGTYQLTADIRSRIINDEGDNGWIGGRLFDVTSGVVVPNSERMINQAVGGLGTRNTTAPINAYLTVTESTTVRIENQRSGSSSAADIRSDANGWTRLAFLKIGGN